MNNKEPDPSIAALRLLIEGNHRFINGLRSVESLLSGVRLKEFAENGQSPFSVILTCSDSRVPTEIIFDRGVGDLFVVRVAGNIVAPSLIGSIEFAAMQLNAPLCVVMGHSGCGAVGAAVKNETTKNIQFTPFLADIVNAISPAVKSVVAVRKEEMSQEEFVRLATIANVKHSVEQITRKSETLKNLVKEKKLLIVGAIYNLHTGFVEFDLPDAIQDEVMKR